MSEQDKDGKQPEEITAPAEGEPQAPGEGEQETQEQERTFTQDEINRIISKRVQEERSRADAKLTQRETEIAQREYDYHVQSTLKNNDLPPQLADILQGGDTATFDASLAAFEKLLDDATQKAVAKRLMGKAPPANNPAADPEAAKRAGIRHAMGLGERNV